jgi:hypothetical protein
MRRLFMEIEQVAGADHEDIAIQIYSPSPWAEAGRRT